MTARRRVPRVPRAIRWTAIAALAALTGAAWWIIGLPGNLTRGDEVRVFVRKGATFREAADSLAAHGVIHFPRLFSAYAHVRGHDTTLRWGTYVLRTSYAWEQTLDLLRLAKGVVHSVTIPEGWMLSEIASAVGDALDLPPDSVVAAARDTALLHRLGDPSPTLEGYLFPATYSFPDQSSAHEAVRTMVAAFEQAWKPAWDTVLPRIKLSRHDVITLASIVEREVVRPEERPIVAAVYLNRLRVGMALQADPTINYALGRRPGRVLLKDLKVKSPYNTYMYPGLPPGPIGSPGLASIEAVLYPAHVPYRFFVAAPDGHHEFTRTYAEHLAAIRMVRSRPDSAAHRAPAPAKPRSP
ncbi:MAG TPA: endolytic transglycosylase MltG [Gemmatimonadaceae bacterium]|nr:endolytic transglycosylase MltG [Gemmatimonadaceae bacterium]